MAASIRIPASECGLVGLLQGPPAGSPYLDDPECRAAVDATGTLLEQLGCDVEVASPEPMFEGQFSQSLIATIAGDTALRFSYCRTGSGRPVTDEEMWWASPEQGGDGFDLLVTPTLGSPPPEIGWMTGEQEGQRIASFIPYTHPVHRPAQRHRAADGQPAAALDGVGAAGRGAAGGGVRA